MSAVHLLRLALLLVLWLPCAGAAEAHAVLVETAPADGTVLPQPPDRIRLVFNEPVSLIAAQVLDVDGRNVIGEGAAEIENGVVELPLAPSLARGTYVASYRVVSLDGHPVGGSLIFSVGEASAAPNLAPQTSARAWHALWTMVRAAFDAGVLASAGGVLFRLAVARSGPVAGEAARIAGRLATIGLVAATLSIGVQGGLLIGGPIGSLLAPATWRTGLVSITGTSALVAAAGLMLILAGSRPSAAGRALACAGAVVALASYALAGHVVTAGPRWLTVPALLLHTSAVAFWVGSLLPLRAMLFTDDAAAIVRRFSTVAMLAVAILVLAGIVIAALQVRGLEALVTTPYGRMLLTKLALVACLLLLAALNKLRLTPALGRRDPGADTALRRAIDAELALVGAILIATAALGTTPPPRALRSEHVHMPEHHAPHAHHAHGVAVEMASAGRRATVTFASAHAGATGVEIAIVDAGGIPAEAREVTFTAANPAAGVEPIRRSAEALRPGVWEIKGLSLVPAGQWSIGVEALVSDFEKPIFAGRVELR